MKAKTLITLFAIIALMACGNNNKGNSTQNDDDNTTQEATAAEGMDSVAYSNEIAFSDEAKAAASVFCKYPATGDMSNSIRNWICEQLDDSKHLYANKLQTLATQYGVNTLRGDSTSVANDISDGMSYEGGILHSDHIRLEPVYEDSDYLVMGNTSSCNIGGPEITYYYYCAIFSKDNGRLISGEEMQSMHVSEIKSLIEKVKAGSDSAEEEE